MVLRPLINYHNHFAIWTLWLILQLFGSDTITFARAMSSTGNSCCGNNKVSSSSSSSPPAPTIPTSPPKTQQVQQQQLGTASFYQRKLPETCIAFASRQGKKIFHSALHNKGLKSFYNLIEQHHTQTEPAYCGVSTLVLVLNALAVDPGQHWKGPWRWYEEKMLNCCLDLEEVKNTGITLKNFQCLALCQGLSVDLQYCDETTTLDDFRRAVEIACVETEDEDDEEGSENSDGQMLQALVVSYSRKILKQTGTGHFSPVAAYDKVSDLILILDTARFKYGAHWAPLPLVYEAMNPIDPDTGKSRGFALLSFIPPPSKADATTATQNGKRRSSISLIDTSLSSPQPTSILFRSKMNQNVKRRQYKEYLASLSDQSLGENGNPTFESVRSYWYRNGDLTDVWSIVEPLRLRDEDERKAMYKMRVFLDDLMTMNSLRTSCASKGTDSDFDKTTAPARCHDDNNKHCVSENEAIFIIYLASISAEKRKDIIMNAESDADQVVREILEKEAALIASAIEISDQMTAFEK